MLSLIEKVEQILGDFVLYIFFIWCLVSNINSENKFHLLGLCNVSGTILGIFISLI